GLWTRGSEAYRRRQGLSRRHTFRRRRGGHGRWPCTQCDCSREHAGRGLGAGVLCRADDRIRRERLSKRHRKERTREAKVKPLVGIIMGSDSDLSVMQEAVKVLKQFEVGYEIGVYSAHRSPHRTLEYVKSAIDRGLKLIIAGAVGFARLAGVR